ncbi:MAG: hypothetical protein ACRDJU_04485 [Actinomycetota bacterium]
MLHRRSCFVLALVLVAMPACSSKAPSAHRADSTAPGSPTAGPTEASPTTATVPTPTPTPTTSPLPSPTAGLQIDAAAFRGQGTLAFVSGDGLDILDGSSAAVHRVAVPSGLAASYPAWSPDGAWLAFLADPAASTQAPTNGEIRSTNPQAGLWLAKADGSDAHLVSPEVEPYSDPVFAWSPVTDALAVSPVLPSGQTGGLLVLDAATGRQVQVVPPTPDRSTPVPDPRKSIPVIGSTAGTFAWSPDGSRIAVATTQLVPGTGAYGGTIETVGSGGGPLVPWINDGEDVAHLAGWWPDGKGIVFWQDPQDSASLTADGAQLVSLAVGSTKPVALATTLIDPAWVQPEPGTESVAVVSGSDRRVWVTKAIAVCGMASGSCQSLAGTSGQVALDPAWSADGEHLAFVKAAAETGSDTSTSVMQSWEGTHTLWIAGPGGTGATELAAGRGASSPEWSADGSSLLFVSGNALFLAGVRATTATLIAGPLGQSPWPGGFYGRVDWRQDFAWHR